MSSLKDLCRLRETNGKRKRSIVVDYEDEEGEGGRGREMGAGEWLRWRRRFLKEKLLAREFSAKFSFGERIL